ncbi:MAG: hypothetical protein Q8941_17510 [Bacteroidota bacterium]|nr:hypothetical protein [Bacteroidota bacterium]
MRIKAVLVLSLVILPAISVKSQVLRGPVAAPYTGFGAYSIHHADVFSFTSNQASLAELESGAVGVYAERRFMLSELNEYNAVIGITGHPGNFGLKTSYSGFSDYNETQIGLAYARKLGTKADIGVQFNYNGIRIAAYGNASAISAEAGVIFHLTEKLHVGFHINNPAGGKLGKDHQEKLPMLYTAGFGYDASDKFFFGTEIIKEEDQPVNVNAGIQYKLIPQLLARAGISSATSSVWLGAGLLWKSFRLDITSSYHPLLGITPGLLLLISLSSKGELKTNDN